MNLYNLSKEFSNCYSVVAEQKPLAEQNMSNSKKNLWKSSYRLSIVAGM